MESPRIEEIKKEVQDFGSSFAMPGFDVHAIANGHH